MGGKPQKIYPVDSKQGQNAAVPLKTGTDAKPVAMGRGKNNNKKTTHGSISTSFKYLSYRSNF